MGLFLLILLIFFVIIPIVRVGWRVWQFQSRIRRMQRDIYGAAQAAAGHTGAKGASPRTGRRKKIDPNMGEYVAFEEISVTASAGTSARPKPSPSEPQVEDADWEELR